MMRAFRSLIVLTLVILPAAVAAQGNPVSNTARDLAKETGANLLAAGGARSRRRLVRPLRPAGDLLAPQRRVASLRAPGQDVMRSALPVTAQADPQ